MKDQIWIALVIAYVLAVSWAIYTDHKRLGNPGAHHGDSHFKKILISSRDSAIRGCIIGALSGGGPYAVVEQAVLWTTIAGSTTALSDRLAWSTKLYGEGNSLPGASDASRPSTVLLRLPHTP